jgi:hypothetical protein
MSRRISEHIRSNIVGYVAIFLFAIGGTAYATHPGGDNTIDSGDIINNQVRSVDVRDDGLANGGLTAADLAPDSVGSSEVAPDSLDAVDLNAGSVAASEVSDESLGSDELAPSSVGSSEVSDESLGSADLGAGSVGGSEVAADAIGSGQVAPDSLAAVDLAPDSVGNSELAANSVTGVEVAFGSLSGTDIRQDSLSGNDIFDGSIASSEIGTGAVGPSEIGTGAVGASEVADESLGTAEFASSIPAAKVTATAGQTIPNNQFRTLNFNSERYDTAGMHSLTSNNSRLTAPVTGIYAITVNIRWDDSGFGDRQLTLVKSGGPTPGTIGLAREAKNGSGPPQDAPYQNISTVARLTAGEFVEASVVQGSGFNLALRKEVEMSPEFSMTWLAPGP